MIVHPEATYTDKQHTAVLVMKCRTNWQKVKRSAEVFLLTVVLILGAGAIVSSKAHAAALHKEDATPAILTQDKLALSSHDKPKWEQRKDRPKLEKKDDNKKHPEWKKDDDKAKEHKWENRRHDNGRRRRPRRDGEYRRHRHNDDRWRNRNDRNRRNYPWRNSDDETNTGSEGDN